MYTGGEGVIPGLTDWLTDQGVSGCMPVSRPQRQFLHIQRQTDRQTDRHKSSGYISRYKEWEMTATDKQLNCYPPLDVLQYEVSLNAVSTRREPDVECCLGRKCETSRRHLCPVQGAVQYTPGCSVLEKMAFWSYSSNTCEFHHFTVTDG